MMAVGARALGATVKAAAGRRGREAEPIAFDLTDEAVASDQ